MESFDNLASVLRPHGNLDFSQGVSASRLADHLAQNFNFPIKIKQTVLETVNVNERLETVITAFEEEKQYALIENQIKSKSSCSCRRGAEDISKRRLRAIREELGDIPEVSEE